MKIIKYLQDTDSNSSPGEVRKSSLKLIIDFQTISTAMLHHLEQVIIINLLKLFAGTTPTSRIEYVR